MHTHTHTHTHTHIYTYVHKLPQDDVSGYKQHHKEEISWSDYKTFASDTAVHTLCMKFCVIHTYILLYAHIAKYR